MGLLVRSEVGVGLRGVAHGWCLVGVGVEVIVAVSVGEVSGVRARLRAVHVADRLVLGRWLEAVAGLERSRARYERARKSLDREVLPLHHGREEASYARADAGVSPAVSAAHLPLSPKTRERLALSGRKKETGSTVRQRRHRGSQRIRPPSWSPAPAWLRRPEPSRPKCHGPT